MQNFFRMALLAVVLAALALTTAPSAEATKLKQQNLTQLITEAQSIVAGEVVKVTDGIADNGMPYTEVTLKVGDVAKGGIQAESDYTFRQFGLLKPRDMGNGKQLLAVTPAGFPTWSEGEFAVAFLYTPARKTGLQTTAGLAQGKLTMVNGQLVNQFNNVGLFDGVEINPQLLSESENQLLNTQAGAVDAAAFMTLVSRAVSEQWIENGEMQ